MIRPTWDEMFMIHSILAGVRSSCLVRRCGAVLVRDKRIIASGYNGAPPENKTCLDVGTCFYQSLAYQDSEKGLGTYIALKEERKSFCIAAHAEKNAFNQCSLHGISAIGSVLYSTNFPCPRCVMDAIVPNKISKIFVWKDYLRNLVLTMDEYRLSKYSLRQAGIEIVKLDLPKERVMEIFHESLMTGDRLSYIFDPSQPLFNLE